MNYEKKYLKYKSKYFQLNNQIGGTLEDDEAREINAAFPTSTTNTTNDQINNILYMSRFLKKYKRENFHLINQTNIIRRLITYLTNYEFNVNEASVREKINDYYIFLLESLIVTINNSNSEISNGTFFYIPSDNENMTSLLTYINENKKAERYINLTLKLINAIFDKMLMKDGFLYGESGGSVFTFIIATIIYLTNNISLSKTNYSITKVKAYIKKLKTENNLNTIDIFLEDGKYNYKINIRDLSHILERLNVKNLQINELLREYIECI